MEPQKSIKEVTEEISGKETLLEGARLVLAATRSVLDKYVGMNIESLQPEAKEELITARMKWNRAAQFIAKETPVLEKLKKYREENQPKEDDVTSGTSDSSGTTVKMVETRTKKEIVELQNELLQKKIPFEDAIEDIQDELKNPKSSTVVADLEDELYQKQKALKRLVRDYEVKIAMIRNVAEAEKERVKAEHEAELMWAARNHRNSPMNEDYFDDLGAVGHDATMKTEDWLMKNPQQQERRMLGSLSDVDEGHQRMPLPPPHQQAAAVDKDTLLMQLMQTQLSFMQKGQGSFADKKLPDFDGNPSDWFNFAATYDRTQRKYRFEDSENVARLQNALKGKAKETVKHLLSNVGNLPKIMKTLEERFGRPEYILDFLVEKAKACKRPDQSKPETIVDFGTAVEDLVTNVCTYNEQEYMHNKQLVAELVEKLPGSMKGSWYRWLSDDGSRRTNLKNFSCWLEKEVKVALLQIKPSTFIGKPDPEEKSAGRNRKSQGSFHAVEGEEKPQEEVKKKSCPACGAKSHGMDNCFSLKKKTIDERWNLAKESRLCFACLKDGHQTKNCKEAKKCGIDGCASMHHKMLHSKVAKESKKKEESDGENKPADSKKKKSTASSSDDSDGSIGVATSVVSGVDGPLPIVPVRLIGPKGVVRVTYALLDSGASRTLILKSLAEELDLKGKPINYRYKLVNGNIVENKSAREVNMSVRGKYRSARTFPITDAVTAEQLNFSPYSLDVEAAKKQWPHLRRYKGPSLKNAVVELVIGADHGYLTMHKDLLYTTIEEPVGIRTVLGWTIQGKVKSRSLVGMSCHIGGIKVDDVLHQLIAESFELEKYGGSDSMRKCMSKEDKRALKTLEDSTVQLENGRWQTRLLWRNELPFPSTGYEEALTSLIRAERRMKKDASFNEVYMNKIKEYRTKGYIRKLSPEEAKVETPRTRYISHFGVVNPNKPGKFRLVFNAAEKADGVSLNDRLMSGPDLLKPLPTILSNFRCHPVVICGDMEDMFHRVFINEEDRTAQRFLWRDGNMEKEPDVYEMMVMIFGATSSPASAIFVKDVNAKQHQEQYPEAVYSITEDMYVDDLLTGAGTEEQAIELRKNIQHINAEGGMIIKKWISNSLAVLESIPHELRLNGTKSLDEKDLWNTERVLGLWYDPCKDEFTFKINFNKVKADVMTGARPTKRQMCSLLMSLFDPLGFVAHYRIKGMILLQRVWSSQVGWDDFIPADIYEDWKKWLSLLGKITDIRIPRCFGTQVSISTVQLHTFVDASGEGFCAISYFRVIAEGQVKVSFVAARVKVAPKKKLTIPRLELEAAVLGSKQASRILHDVKVHVSSSFFWSDSSTALSWITSESARYKEFVANRISKVQQLTSVSDWHWISTKDNVADDATRLHSKTDLTSNSRWLRGPDFLLLTEDNWPKKGQEDQDDVGVVCAAISEKLVCNQEDDTEKTEWNPKAIGETIPEIGRYSSYFRYLRVTAAVQCAARFWINKTLRKEKTARSPWKKIEGARESLLPVEEVMKAEKRLIIYIQQQCRVVETTRSRKYELIKDEIGIIRMRGRINKASNLDEDARSPIVLPLKHRFVDLLIDHYHVLNAHTGRNTVFNLLRLRFWIPDGRHAVRRSWTRCQQCKIQRAKPVAAEMGELPNYRIAAYTTPFAYTGVDMFGPIEVTVGRRHEKRWGMLFTDMVTRGVHLEVTSGLSGDESMMAVSRFVDCRGLPEHMFSDNGTNFHAVAKELEKRQKYYGCKWHFIPPASPHMGGAWESLVKQVKKVLYNLLEGKFPKDQVLLTALKAVEGILNSRPLAFVSGDLDDPESLTPNHFLRGIGVASDGIGNQMATTTSADFSGDIQDEDLRWGKQWERAQALAKQFWDRWTKEVLPNLLRRNKWNKKVEPIQVGDLVLIVDDQSPRNTWTRAVVTATNPGDDGTVRVVEVTTRNFETKTTKSFGRSVVKICPLGIRMGDLDSLPKKDSKSGGRKWKKSSKK